MHTDSELTLRLSGVGCRRYCLSPFGVGFEFLTDLSNGSTQAYVGYTPATAECAVSFRGTEVGLTDIQDVITDINILRVSPDEYNRSDVEVHHGFYSAYRRVAPQLIAELGAAVNSGLCNKVLVTGHSLGGALATLAAVDIALEFPQLQQVRLPAWFRLSHPRLALSLRKSLL